ncbi:MAG: hypothetical protein QM751_10595 [Paludibacteraceae bacterium]
MKKYIFYFTIIVLFTIGCKRFPNLGNGYQLDYNGMNDISIIKCLKNGDAPTIFIYGHILDYAFDSTFIIVAERPRDSVSGIKTMKFYEYNKKFKQSTFRQYWIINKKEKSEYSLDTLTNLARYSNVYGPFQSKSICKSERS